MSDLKCAWVYDFEDEHSDRCETGKPALYYNCNESGPVCEDHTCRCRPKLLTERAEKARSETIQKALLGLQRVGVPESALEPVLLWLDEQKKSGTE